MTAWYVTEGEVGKEVLGHTRVAAAHVQAAVHHSHSVLVARCRAAVTGGGRSTPPPLLRSLQQRKPLRAVCSFQNLTLLVSDTLSHAYGSLWSHERPSVTSPLSRTHQSSSFALLRRHVHEGKCKHMKEEATCAALCSSGGCWLLASGRGGSALAAAPFVVGAAAAGLSPSVWGATAEAGAAARFVGMPSSSRSTLSPPRAHQFGCATRSTRAALSIPR